MQRGEFPLNLPQNDPSSTGSDGGPAGPVHIHGSRDLAGVGFIQERKIHLKSTLFYLTKRITNDVEAYLVLHKLHVSHYEFYLYILQVIV